MTAFEELTEKIRNFFEHNKEREAILVIHPDTLDELMSEMNLLVCGALRLDDYPATSKTIIQMYGLRMPVYKSPDAQEILIAKTFGVINHL